MPFAFKIKGLRPLRHRSILLATMQRRRAAIHLIAVKKGGQERNEQGGRRKKDQGTIYAYGNLVCLLTDACLNVHLRRKWNKCRRCFGGNVPWCVQFRRKRSSCVRCFSGSVLLYVQFWRNRSSCMMLLSRSCCLVRADPAEVLPGVTGMGRGGSSPGADGGPGRSASRGTTGPQRWTPPTPTGRPGKNTKSVRERWQLQVSRV